MPQLACEAHTRRRERVVFGKLELGGEDSTFKRRAVGALYQGFPVEHVVFGAWAGGDAVWRVVCKVLVFLEEAFRGDGRCHCVLMGGGGGCVRVWEVELRYKGRFPSERVVYELVFL